MSPKGQESELKTEISIQTMDPMKKKATQMIK